MTVQLWCLLIGAILPYIWAFSSIPYRLKQFGQPDLNHPRVQGDQLTDAGARAWGAQGNAWEALAVFAAANIAAFMAGVDPNNSAWSTAAMIWVGARLGHGVFYIAGIAPLRVLCFVSGLGMSFWIFVMALSA